MESGRHKAESGVKSAEVRGSDSGTGFREGMRARHSSASVRRARSRARTPLSELRLPPSAFTRAPARTEKARRPAPAPGRGRTRAVRARFRGRHPSPVGFRPGAQLPAGEGSCSSELPPVAIVGAGGTFVGGQGRDASRRRPGDSRSSGRPPAGPRTAGRRRLRGGRDLARRADPARAPHVNHRSRCYPQPLPPQPLCPAVLLLQDPLIRDRMLGEVHLGQLERGVQFFLAGGTRPPRTAGRRYRLGAALRRSEPAGVAAGGAMMATRLCSRSRRPRAKARPRLNVKRPSGMGDGFSFGSNRSRLATVRSRRASPRAGTRRPVCSIRPGAVSGGLSRARGHATRRHAARTEDDSTRFGAPETSPRMSPWRVTHSIVIPGPGLERPRRFPVKTYVDRRGRLSRSRRPGNSRKMIRPGDRENPPSRDDPASPTRRPCAPGATGPAPTTRGRPPPEKNSRTRSPYPGSTLPIASSRRATDRVDSPAGHPLYRVSSPREGRRVGPPAGPRGRRIRRLRSAPGLRPLQSRPRLPRRPARSLRAPSLLIEGGGRARPPSARPGAGLGRPKDGAAAAGVTHAGSRMTRSPALASPRRPRPIPRSARPEATRVQQRTAARRGVASGKGPETRRPPTRATHPTPPHTANSSRSRGRPPLRRPVRAREPETCRRDLRRPSCRSWRPSA